MTSVMEDFVLKSGDPAMPVGMKSKELKNTMTTEEACRFCKPSAERLMIMGEYGFATWDRHPVNEGHFLVIPHRHFADYFDINEIERNELWSLVEAGKKLADERFAPDGYNIGINVGHYAGQSIHHLHIHVIPRYKGDVENPKGGVRGVVPDRRHYSFDVPGVAGNTSPSE